MGLLRHAELAKDQRPVWCWVVIHIAVACLVISLTSRFLRPVNSEIATAYSNSPRAKIQNLAADASVWTVPVATALPEPTAPPGDVVVGQDEPLLTLHWDSTVCDRAPPVS